MRFDGKVVLVSGAGSGIGRATAIGFAERGAKVGVADIDRQRADAVAEEIGKAGGTALAIAADAGTPDGIEAMVAGTVRAFGGLDVLHNNAFGQPKLPGGQSRLAFLGDLDERVWTHTIELGLTGVFRAMKRAIPELLARGGGAIVNTASISGLFADFAIGAYNTAKAGVVNLTRVAAIEYASKSYVPLNDLHDAVGKRIASLLGVEAAMVTSGAAAALTVGTAACITGTNQAWIRRLPDIAGTDMKSEVRNSDTPKRSCTSARSTVTGSVTGSSIASASTPSSARRAPV